MGTYKYTQLKLNESSKKIIFKYFFHLFLFVGVLNSWGFIKPRKDVLRDCQLGPDHASPVPSVWSFILPAMSDPNSLPPHLKNIFLCSSFLKHFVF